jgi:cobalt-zinc-cadmium efflux system protein
MAEKESKKKVPEDGKACPVDGTGEDGDAYSCAHEHEPSVPEKGHAHEHPHEHSHHHVKPPGHEHKVKERKLLALSIGLTFGTMILEFVGGYLSNSLALISDAGHMLTHVLALSLSYAAIWIASRAPGPEYSFGLYRSETLAALFNCFFLVAISVWILWQAYEKFLHPGAISVMEMLVIAVIGLVVNLATAAILMKANPEGDRNIKGAFMHTISDTASSVGIVIGAVIINYTGWLVVDPILSVLITVLILAWVYSLARSSIRVLLERAPEGIDLKEVERVIMKKVPEVQGVHDIHIWEITTNMYNMTAHVVLENQSLHQAIPTISKVKKVLKDEFNIGHAAIQMECTCVEE